MAMRFRQGRWVRIILIGVTIAILLGVVSSLAVLVLGSLNIIDVAALKTDLQQRLLPGGSREEEPEYDELQALEKELADLKGENSALRGELGQKSREVLDLLQELDELKAKQRELEEERQRQIRIGEVYGEMRPQEAAAILGRLPDGEALEVLLLLDANQVSQILAQLDPGKAATLTQAMNK